MMEQQRKRLEDRRSQEVKEEVKPRGDRGEEKNNLRRREESDGGGNPLYK